MFGWIRRLFELNINFPDWSAPSEHYIPGYEVVDSEVAMPNSRSISGLFCRWHNRSILPTVVPLWRTHPDDAQKWSSHGRFAGKEQNCGRFFAFKEAVATAEAKLSLPR